jgi:hypothetical protein
MDNNFDSRINLNNKQHDQVKLILNQCEEPLLYNQIKFLTSRPWWNKDHDSLQLSLSKMFPGTHLVSDPSDDIDLYKMNTIQIPGPNYKIHRMQKSACHDNSMELFLKDPENAKLFSGYALSTDRLWRHHSWIITQTGDIIETTQERLIYLGYDVSSKFYLFEIT